MFLWPRASQPFYLPARFVEYAQDDDDDAAEADDDDEDYAQLVADIWLSYYTYFVNSYYAFLFFFRVLERLRQLGMRDTC